MRALLLLTFVLTATLTYAQSTKRSNIWYFGYGAGLDFNGGAPVAITDGALSTFEGCATICDEKGSLLFYTDGRTIWNRTHQPMPNANDLGGYESATQSGIIVPYPGQPNRYYVFSIDDASGLILRRSGAQYALVDMALNGGLGGIVSKNNPLVDKATEKLTTVRHCNGRDYWVILHEANNSVFRSYLIDPTGINLNYVRSEVDAKQTCDPGYLKASPDGTKLALGNHYQLIPNSSDIIEGFFEILDFDHRTGQISHAITFQKADFNVAYGVEFSPDGKLLYLSYFQTIIQLDLSYPSGAEMLANSVAIGRTDAFYFGALQRGPDGKIYVTINSYEYIGVIGSPTVKGAGCGFVQKGIFLNGKKSGLGFTNLMDGDVVLPTVSIAAQKSPAACSAVVLTSVVSDSSLISYQWYREGQPIAGARRSRFTPTQGGAYQLKIQTQDCRALTAESNTLTVALDSLPLPPTGQDQILCAGGTIAAFNVRGTNVKWYADSILQNQIGSGNTYLPTVAADQVSTQVYFLTQTTSGGCVSPVASVRLVIEELPTLRLVSKTYQGCFSGSSADVLTLAGGDTPGATYRWWAPDGALLGRNRTLEVRQAGTYQVTITNGQGCSRSDTINVVEYCMPVVHVPEVFTPNGDGINDIFEIKSKEPVRLTLTIYNRWGEVLLHSDSGGWDGQYQDRPCPAGVYAWKLAGELLDGGSQAKGFKKAGQVLLTR